MLSSGQRHKNYKIYSYSLVKTEKIWKWMYISYYEIIVTFLNCDNDIIAMEEKVLILSNDSQCLLPIFKLLKYISNTFR